MDLEVVRKHPLAECESCPLYNNSGFVPTFNPHPPSGIAVIGEAPGAHEERRGVPFTGPSGDLLNQVLQHHGLHRENVMITNTALCRPKDNADPPKAALAACRPRLEHEIAQSGVDTIIAVGKVAAHELLATKASMRKMRVGPPKRYVRDHSIKVIPTWHPAYSLRSPDSFPDLVFDVGKARGKVENDWTEPRYRVFDSPGVALRALDELASRFDRFVIDIECGFEKDADFVHPSEYPLLCVGIAFAPGAAVVIGENALNDVRVQDKLRQTLSQARLIAHNGKFDLAALRSICGKLELWFDTMLASNCLDERPGRHGLKVLSIERLGAPDYEQDIRVYVPRSGNYGDIPREVLYKYNAYDVVCTWALYELFSREFSESDWRKHDFLIRAANALIELELQGIFFDVDYNEKLAFEYKQKLDDLEAHIGNIVGRELNPRSPQQITQYYLEQGLVLPSTNAELLTELSEKVTGDLFEFTQALLKHRREAKLYGTYVKGLARRVSHGKIFTTYLLHGTTSGRLASREPNLQNVVRDKPIRNQFVASSEDHCLLQCDYKQAEGRVITTLARDEYLRSIFADPERDLFTELNNDIFGVGNHGKEERVKIKSVFYGLAYGRGNAAIAKELDISLQEANNLIGAFKSLIPATIAWQAAIKRQVLAGEDLTTPYGRKRSFWLITERNQSDVLNEALSYKPQSIASDICLDALITLLPKFQGIAIPRLTIHDAIIVECLKKDAEEVASLMRIEMVASARRFTDYVPFEVDATTGYRWGEL